MARTSKTARRPYRLGRRAETSEETRQRLVEATFRLHGERGIAETSMKDIAERAGVSVGTVYHHFPSYADAITASVAGAVADAGTPHVVMLSAGGADLADGTGPITGLHRMEQALRSTGTVLTALRSGHFQEKVADLLPAAEAGVYPVFAPSADVPRISRLYGRWRWANAVASASSRLTSPPSCSITR